MQDRGSQGCLGLGTCFFQQAVFHKGQGSFVNVFNCGKGEGAFNPTQRTAFFFSAARGCSQSCARTNPWFRGRILGGKRAQEPTPGSAVKHCWFLDTGGGGGDAWRAWKHSITQFRDMPIR